MSETVGNHIGKLTLPSSGRKKEIPEEVCEKQSTKTGREKWEKEIETLREKNVDKPGKGGLQKKWSCTTARATEKLWKGRRTGGKKKRGLVGKERKGIAEMVPLDKHVILLKLSGGKKTSCPY